MTDGLDLSQREPLLPLASDSPHQFHDEAHLDRYKEATLHILEHTGVRFESPKALALLREHGAAVDDETGVVRFPPDLVLKSIEAAPRDFVLGSRDGSCDLDLSLPQSYCCSNGSGTEVIDWHDGERRQSTEADLAAVTRATDYLGTLQYWWPTVGANDRGATHELHEFRIGFENTVKHLQGMVQGERLARYAVEMGVVIAGSAEELRRRPVMSDLIGTVCPLVNDRKGIEAALVFAEAGVPVVTVSMPSYGTTAPATQAGTLAMAMAEVLSATVCMQLAHPGAPTIGWLLPVYADPRTAALVTVPVESRGRLLPTELVHHFGLPAMDGFGGTDEDLPGTWLGATETAHSLMIAAASKAELITTGGLTDRYQLFTPEQMMLDADIYRRAATAFRALPVGDEEFALDVIDDIGPGGHFLAHRHTRRHLRSAMKRSIGQEIAPDGSSYRDAVEVARERGIALLDDYRPEPLDEGKAAELRRICAAADAELLG